MDVPGLFMMILISVAVLIVLGFKIWIVRWLWKKYRRRQLGECEGGGEKGERQWHGRWV